MLIAKTRVTGTSVAPPKQIAIIGTINTVMYTVPKGRKFIGKIAHISAGNRTDINGVSFYFFENKSMALTNITLIAGTEVKEGAVAGGRILGVEYDA